MDPPAAVVPKGHRRGFRRIVYLLILLVIVPTAMLLALGIVMLSYWQAEQNLLFGILVVTLVGCLVTGAVLALFFLRKEAALSKLQLDFVSKVSHELRTPLTSIRMFVDMLQTSADDPEQTRICLEVLERETGRLSERIERLLDWGRMEAGRRIYQREAEQVEGIVADAVTGFHNATASKERQVDLDLADELPPVLGDRAALVDALINLMTNADKYSDEGEPILVRARPGARHVRLSVADRGIGIPRAEHRRIFQKFYRVDERLSRTVEGTGLGLAIVQHVAQGHGGRVEVESAPGKGSTFTLVLPRSTADAMASAREAAEEPDPATAPG
ncbi:MAG: two-component sensor histidine kinase [Deltaproteobacteria bacterium]|jgi:two-component system phosphate regulon sensor histidine kinase PhoR|nr:two-component sensor histidine kinase [Deltaproteobacteria bacterium]MBW2533890.1 two-component sensor histidine kinase [Deltaproteobacteria bacterium]